MLNAVVWRGWAVRVALPAGIGLFVLAVAAAGIAATLGLGGASAVLLASVGSACCAVAFSGWRALNREAPGAAAFAGPTAAGSPGAASDTQPDTSPFEAADWERALLERLPGVSLLVQPVNEGALTDWLLLASQSHLAADVVRSHPPVDLPIDLPGDPPTTPRVEAPELLSHWLARHPRFRPAEVVAALQAQAGAPADPRLTPWCVLPLGVAHRVLWLPPAPAMAASAPLVSAQPQENDRESIAYTVSHDLRAPIRVIEGFTRIVHEDYGHLLDRIGNDHLDRVLGAASRMNGMIDALLALSRLSTQPLAREAVPLSAMAEQIIEELRIQAPMRVVQALIEPGLSAQGDPAMLHSVLENLLGNAWKYTARRAEGRIELGLTRLSRLRPGVTSAQDRAVYFVRDNGAGFDMRFAERLFGAFQRLHSASEFAGTGVGLASVRRIVTRHGGEIWAQAAVDQGACFYFTLP